MAERIAKKAYGDQSIKSLKGADRVRKRPAVIFGSDDLIGCQHSFIEILANSVDEAREGYGDKIIVDEEFSRHFDFRSLSESGRIYENSRYGRRCGSFGRNEINLCVRSTASRKEITVEGSEAHALGLR